MGKFHPEYRQLANPKHFNRFLDGGGVLSKRDEIADRFDYNWHARKLTFEPHFRSYVLLHITKYQYLRISAFGLLVGSVQAFLNRFWALCESPEQVP